MLKKRLHNKVACKTEEFVWKEKDEKIEQPDFDKKVDKVCEEIATLLKEKNRSYGNAALDPIRVFSRLDSYQQLLVRIDDKLSRIKRGDNTFNEDTVRDLVGYLILVMIAERMK